MNSLKSKTSFNLVSDFLRQKRLCIEAELAVIDTEEETLHVRYVEVTGRKALLNFSLAELNQALETLRGLNEF